MSSERFLTREHIKSESDFARVYAARCSVADDLLVVYVCANQSPYARLGISVSKRVGTAVERVYVRRRVREAFRRNKVSIAPGFDIVCVARRPAKHRKSDVAGSLVRLIGEAVDRWARRGATDGRRKRSSGKPAP